MEKVVIGGDHRGFQLKENLKKFLVTQEYELIDVGCHSAEAVDFPDVVQELVKPIQSGLCEKGIMLCGSGVGASVASNKFKGIRAGICHDTFSAHQGVEDDAMNVICLGGGIIGESIAKEIVMSFLNAKFKPEERFIRRLEKIKKLEE
jgi:ribose 5-phosphate isomerase B